MAAIFKSSLQNLSPLPTSLKVEPLAKPKTGLKFFVNTTKPKTKVLTSCMTSYCMFQGSKDNLQENLRIYEPDVANQT